MPGCYKSSAASLNDECVICFLKVERSNPLRPAHKLMKKATGFCLSAKQREATRRRRLREYCSLGFPSALSLRGRKKKTDYFAVQIKPREPKFFVLAMSPNN